MPPSASTSRLSINSNSAPALLDPPPNEGLIAPSPTPRPAAAAEAIDRSFHAALARFTGGLSPAALALAFADWQLHLLASPGKQAALTGQALQNALQFADAIVPRHPTFQPWSLIRPPETDRRFTGSDWELPSFNLLAQAFLLTEQWWHSTTTDIHGLGPFGMFLSPLKSEARTRRYMYQNSFAFSRMSLASPAPQRLSIRTLRPSIQPNCCSPSRKAARRASPSGSSAARTPSAPTRRKRSVCCAPATAATRPRRRQE